MGFEISNRDWQIAYDYAKNAILSADPAHDFDHILRVVRLTRQLCEKIPYASSSLATLIALLHEMNDDKLFPVSQVEKTREMLLSLSLPSDEADFIIEAISLISYRKHPTLSEDTRIEVKSFKMLTELMRLVLSEWQGLLPTGEVRDDRYTPMTGASLTRLATFTTSCCLFTIY